tara:strand:- start:21552 stop:21788 length:237 start_codon:yes stop_codon:yes gene_type:complete
MMRVGFYVNDLESVVGNYDIDDEDLIEEIAKDFAEENHQIDEQSDMRFSVCVEDSNKKIHEVLFYTEYDPRFEVEEII